MAVSRVVVGGNSPAWLGPTLLGLGLVAWTGAGAMAETDAPAPPAAKAAEVNEPSPAADADEGEAIVIVEDGDEAPEPDAARPAADSPPRAAAEPEVCAPIVELMFANGESEVDRTELLRGFITTAEAFPDHKIVVEGYASADGSEQGNLHLSHRRATRAKANLIKQGIDAERISVQAFGEYRPNLDGDADRDRRVVVKIQGVATCPEKAAEE